MTIEPVYQTERVTVYQGDCLEVMYSLKPNPKCALLTDPPYGIGEAAGKNKSRGLLAKSKDFGNLEWDNEIPSISYFNCMTFITHRHIMWGGNFFAEYLGNSPCWLVWNKDNGKTDFADCELAWTSLSGAVRLLRWKQQGMLQEDMKNKEHRYHPTQKPVAVMRWCLTFLQDAEVILDPFAGSGTTGVAALREGMRCILIEREPQYIEIIKRRLEAEEAQLKLF